MHRNSKYAVFPHNSPFCLILNFDNVLAVMQKFGCILFKNSFFEYRDCCSAEKGGFSHFFLLPPGFDDCLEIGGCISGFKRRFQIGVKAVELPT